MVDMTLEEALLAASDEVELVTPVHDVLLINPETRKINVPDSEKLFGVRNDIGVERKHFKCPRVVGDGVDLSQHKIFVNYVASNSDGIYDGSEEIKSYWCEDLSAIGEYVTFSWKLSGNVLQKAGYIAFAVYAKKADTDGNLQTKWHTTIAVGSVLDTLPDGQSIEETHPDLVTQLLERMDEMEAGLLGKAGTGENAEIFNDYANNDAYGKYSHAEGYQTFAGDNRDGHEGDGWYSHAEGQKTLARGRASHSEGVSTQALGDASHAENDNTKAHSSASHAEGSYTETYSVGSHSEGSSTVAGAGTQKTNISPIALYSVGAAAHAEGIGTLASGKGSHAGGYKSVAAGDGASAIGNQTKASGAFQHVQGKFNAEDTANKYAHIVGNGTSDTARSNAHTVDWNGNAEYKGDVIANGCGSDNPISLAALAEKVSSLEMKLNNLLSLNTT